MQIFFVFVILFIYFIICLPIELFQPLITVLSQIGNVATFWNKVKQIWGKSVGRKRAYIM